MGLIPPKAEFGSKQIPIRALIVQYSIR